MTINEARDRAKLRLVDAFVRGGETGAVAATVRRINAVTSTVKLQGLIMALVEGDIVGTEKCQALIVLAAARWNQLTEKAQNVSQEVFYA